MANKKLKVSKTVKDRFKVTKSGQLSHAHGGLKHRLSKESTSLKSRGKKDKLLTGPEKRKFTKILGVRRRKKQS